MKAISALLDETNIGGLQHRVLILPVIAVTGYPYQSLMDYKLFQADVLEVSHPIYSKWIAFNHTADSGILKEETEKKDQGPILEYKIECFVPKVYEARVPQFEELLQLQFLVICADQNDYARIVGLTELGEKTRGCDFNYKYSTGKNGKDRNGYLCTFSFETTRKAPIAEGLGGLEIETATYDL